MPGAMALAPINVTVDAINEIVIMLEGIAVKEFMVRKIFFVQFEFFVKINILRLKI